MESKKENKRVIKNQEGDKFLIDVAKGTCRELCSIQRCRLYMQVETLVDIVCADDTMLKSSVVKGIQFKSKLKQPWQGNPSDKDWAIRMVVICYKPT